MENIVSSEGSQSRSYDGLSSNQEPVDEQIEQDTIKKPNALDELGEKIFLDRYALKDMAKNSLSVGDTVIVCVDLKTRRREIGTVKSISDSIVTVELRDGISVKCAMEHVDKPIELKPEQMMDRVARGIATVEGEKTDEWFEKFRWMMEEWKFVPAGRILTAAGTDQQLTYYNCFVLPSPRDSREGIVEILSHMMEIMSRGGGVGINLSSLRPRHCYVKGVNGRSSGAVSWGGLYSFTTGLIEQGGCLTPDTLVFTKHGLLRLDEIVKHKNRGWREQTLTVMTDEGERLSHQVFNNGVADVLRVETDMGLHLTGTPNHKVKIMTPSGPQWRRLDELQTGDAIIVQLGQHQGQIQALRKPTYHHHNQDAVTLPNILDEELAFFLGYFMGDGFMTTKDGDWRLGVSVAHNSYLIKEMPALLRSLFPGVNVRIQQKDNDASLTYLISNRAVKEFLQLNGFDKAQSSTVAVPRLIRQSPSDIVGAFLRGLFEADGGLSHCYPTLSSTSKQLIDEVAVLLIGLGCPVKVGKNTTSENRYGCKPIWRLRIHSFRGLETWKNHIGCDPRSRFAVCLDVAPDKTKEITYKLSYSEYWLEPVLTEITLPQLDPRATEQRFKATDQPLRRKLLRYLRGDRNLTLSAYDTLNQTHPNFAKAARPVSNLWFAFVERVTKAGQSLTLDMEVDDNHTYLANGMVTHNSRRGALILVLNDWHPDLMEFINSKREMGKITNANISIAISDDFMAAVKADADWNLEFPDTLTEDYDELWDGDLKKWKSLGKPVLVYKTLKARQIWNTIIESAWASAEPGVWFIDKANQMSNSYYFNSLACTNPCGEQSLPAWSVCDLGAINLSKFVVNGGVDWEVLGRVIRYSVRFLDNVIEATPYFFEEHHELQFSERRIGLNTMGLAEMLIRLGIRYGSKESLEFIDKLYDFIATESYLASADLAVEKGAFPEFDAERFLKSGYMQKMPDEVRKAIEEKGIRNVTLLTQAPNGCVTPDTLVFADGALKPIATLADPDGPQWQDVSFTTYSDSGPKLVNKFYVNGNHEVVEVTTARGFKLAATLQHRVRVIDSEGNYEWKQMGELQLGDTLVIARGGLGEAETPRLNAVPLRKRRSKLQLPEMMTPELAELLGFYIGDGSLKERNGLGIAVDSRDSDLIERLQEIIAQTFNLDAYVEDTERNCLIVWAGSYFIPRWMRANELAKSSALDAQIPEPILAGGAETVAAFLRGLFESDGSISKGSVTFVTASERLAREVQIALLGLGIVSTRRSIEPDEGRYGTSTRHEVRLLNSHEVLKFRELVGFASKRKQTLLEACEDKGGRADSIPSSLLRKIYTESEGLPTGIRQEIAGALRCGMTQGRWCNLVSASPALEALPSAALLNGHLFFDVVTDINLDNSFTFDLSVPETNTYIANGIVAHNTIGTMVGTSTGIEPFYFWTHYRKSRLGTHEVSVNVVEEWKQKHPGEKLPPYFVTAMDLTPEEHVKTQAAIQRWIDASISKTHNTPNDFTVEQMRELYELMYELGCKGGTVYRDGSRDEQVLEAKEETEAEENSSDSTDEKEVDLESKQLSSPADAAVKVRPVPYKRHGVTVSQRTPSGTAHITMNDDESGQPFEVFVEIGKGGSDIKAMAEAMGRLMSLLLRFTSPVTPIEKVQEIINQIRGIGGARSYGFGKDKVLSLPDAVGKALEEHYGVQGHDNHINSNSESPVPEIEHPHGVAADICPICGHAAFVRQEGCMSCHACGHSEC